MKKFVLQYQCILDASLDALCQFHTDTCNLPLITPPWIDVTILSMEVPMKQGSIIELQIKRYGLPTLWKMVIATLHCPNTIVDEMIQGPFPYFRHERHFIAINEDETRMEETVTLALPFGWFGALFFPLIQKDMDKMFAYRHGATQKYFKEKNHAVSLR